MKLLCTHISKTRRTAAFALAVSVSFLSDMSFTLSNVRQAIPGYAVLAIYGLTTIGLRHTQGVLSPALGLKATSMVSILGATVIALPFYVFKSLVVSLDFWLAISVLTQNSSTSDMNHLQYLLVLCSPFRLWHSRSFISYQQALRRSDSSRCHLSTL